MCKQNYSHSSIQRTIAMCSKQQKTLSKINAIDFTSYNHRILTGIGLLPKKFRSAFSPNKKASGC